MAQEYIRLPPDSTGAKVPTVQWTDGSDTVEAQQVATAVPVLVTGSITAAGTGQRVSAPCRGFSGATITYSGTYSGGIMVFEYSLDEGSTWNSTSASWGPGASGAGIGGAYIEATGRTLAANQSEQWVVTLPPGATNVGTYSIVGPSTGTLAVKIGVGVFKAPNAIATKTYGDVFHDDANSATTVQVGGHASATPPTAVASADRVRAWLTLNGAQVVMPETLATATMTNVAASASSGQLLASTTGRKGCLMFNAGTSALYIKYGTTATKTTSYTVKIAAGGYWEMPAPIYTGRVDGIWDATGGDGVNITEMS